MYLVYKLYTDPNESLDRENATDSPTDDDFQPVVSKGKNKNEECKKLLDGSVVCGDLFICRVHISHYTAC